jgi:hypothetical protein
MKMSVFIKKPLFVLCASALFILSCKKDNPVDPVDPVQLLESVSYDGLLAYELEYDEQNRISKIVVYEYDDDGKAEYTSVRTFSYSGDNPVSMKTVSEGEIDETGFVRDGNRITVNFSREEGEEAFIELNAQGLPVKYEYGNESDKQTFEYDGVGNLIKLVGERSHRDDDYSYTSTSGSDYTYDGKKAPLSGCATPKWFLILLFNNDVDIKNNRLAETAARTWIAISDGESQSGSSSSTLACTYAYDDAGYALTRTEKRTSVYNIGTDAESTEEESRLISYKYVVKK